MADAAAQAEIVAPSSGAAAPMVANRGPSRAEKRAAAIANLQRTNTTAGVVAAAPAPEAPKPAEVTPPKPVPAPIPESKDDSAERGLAQIENAKKRWLDERAAKEEEISRREARLAQREAEIEGKVSSIVDSSNFDIDSWLDKAKLTDSQLGLLSRASYYRTAEGQKKPEAKQAIDDYRQRTSVASMEERFAELEKGFDERVEKRAQEIAWRVQQQASFASEWTDTALKEVPADKPTFFAKLNATNPRAARVELQKIGAELEKSSGATPKPSEVIAEYENRKRAELTAMGLDPDAILAPPKPAPAAAPAAKPARSLDIAASNLTRPENAPKTRAEKTAFATANLRARLRSTADQT